MNASGDAAETIVRLSLEGFEVIAKVTGSGAKNVAALLYAIMKDKQRTSGKTNLNNMLKSGKELKVFSVKSDNFKKFTEEAKRYGVLYSALINKRTKFNDGIVDIMVRAEDASKINRIVERFKLASYDEVTIRSSLEKTKTAKEKGFQTKTSDDKLIDEIKEKPIKKEKETLNPHLAKTEKSPLSKPFLKMPKTSDRVTKDRPSVREKIKKAKEIIKERKKSNSKSEVSKKNNIKKKKIKDKTK